MMPYDNPLGSLNRDDMEWLSTIESLISLPDADSIYPALGKSINQLVDSDHFAVFHIAHEQDSGSLLYSSNSFKTAPMNFSLKSCSDFKGPSLESNKICFQYTRGSEVLRRIGRLLGIPEIRSAVLCLLSQEQDRDDVMIAFVRERGVFAENELRTLDRIMQLSRIILKQVNVSEASHSHVLNRETIHEEPDVEMIGSCDAMRHAFSALRRFATTDAPVLITGESGTGKEIAAQTIHERSSRANKPFVPINCGAIPETLLESELFGHEKGAFTGAHAQKKGKFEIADEGTLFLDEVGELPLSLQVKLLRFLEDLRFERVGGTRLLRVDVRVIAATNKDLSMAVSNGEFREDLYYRLAVLSINLPPLREREDDVLIMARAFLNRYSEEAGREIRGFTPGAITAIRNHSWMGNVRELINRIRRAVVMADRDWIEPADLGLEETYSDSSALSLPAARNRLERELIQKAIGRTEGNIAKAARELDISRPHLYQLMKKHNINKK